MQNVKHAIISLKGDHLNRGATVATTNTGKVILELILTCFLDAVHFQDT